MPANMTLWGLYQWDNTLFDNLVIPPTTPYVLSRDDLINNILLECAELEVVYPDPDFLKIAIGSWAKARYVSWERYVTVLNIEYNPIENTDRHEDRTINDTENEAVTGEESGQRTTNIKHNNTGTTSGKGKSLNALSRTQQITNTNSVSAFDTEGYSNANKQFNDTDENSDTQYTAESDESINNTVSGTDIEAHNRDNQTDRNRTYKHSEIVHVHGNIGVTTNQKMLRDEVIFWVWDFVHQISREFRQKFCISVY